jgi:signal transduction histidine kinase
MNLKRASAKKISTVSIFFLSFIILGMIFWLLNKVENSKVLESQKDKISKANQELTSLLSQIENQNEMLAQKNENLEELHREKDGLIGIVAHDLRSPLTRIKGLSTLVELSGSLNYEQKDMLGKISKVCEDGNGLIRDLLVINQYESADMLALSSIEINHFIYSMLANYTHVLQTKDLTINFDFQTREEQFMVTDDSYLARILDNLLTNAIKFSPKGKSIFIDITSIQNFIKITIKDEGPGFNVEDLPHLFKKFKKLSARPTAGENSTGLGLSIVKLLVEKLKGTVVVESAPGTGATFIITLPVNLISQNAVAELVLPEHSI